MRITGMERSDKTLRGFVGEGAPTLGCRTGEMTRSSSIGMRMAPLRAARLAGNV